MKKSFLHLALLCILGFHAQAQDRVFYYKESGEKIYLERNSNVKYIHFTNETAAKNHSLLNQLNLQNSTIDTLSSLMYKVSGNTNQKSVINSLFTESIDSNMLFISDMLQYENTILWESDAIVVKFFANAEISNVLASNNIPYKEYKRLGSNPQTYLITLNISEQGAIEYANKLVESKAVVIAQPSF